MPALVQEVQDTPLPTGWRWEDVIDPYYGQGMLKMNSPSTLTVEDALRRLKALGEWAQQLNIEIAPYTHRDISGYILYILWSCNVTRPYTNHFADHECSCGTTVPFTEIQCTNCDREFRCGNCFMAGTTLHDAEGESRCIRCIRRCGCGRYHLHQYTQCASCSPRRQCIGIETTGNPCSRIIELSRANQAGNTDRYYCNTCYRRLCTSCFASNSTFRHPLTNLVLCQQCYDLIDLESGESFDESADLTASQLLIEATSERPVRVCSIEQEFCGGGDNAGLVAEALHEAGLSPYPNVVEYHYARHNYPCHIERDSSVDGGELIYQRMRLDTPEDATHMRNILTILRDNQRAGRIRINVRTGLHVHVDLHGYNLTDARHLAMIFNYLEDPLYRLAAAKYRRHRIVLAGGQYAMSPPKGNWKTNSRFGMDYLRNNGHNHALNLQHFYNAYRTRCRCGVGQFGEDWSQCECENLGKCTAEWRVFNGTSNPRKLHAYIALCQSLTAWAQDRDVDSDNFPEMPFEDGINFDNGDTEDKIRLVEAWKPRLEWMLQNLYFSSEEKEDLFYCIRNSELVHMGETFIAHLVAIPYTSSGRTLTVRHPMQRGNPSDPVTPDLSSTWIPYPNEPNEVNWNPDDDYYAEDGM